MCVIIALRLGSPLLPEAFKTLCLDCTFQLEVELDMTINVCHEVGLQEWRIKTTKTTKEKLRKLGGGGAYF